MTGEIHRPETHRSTRTSPGNEGALKELAKRVTISSSSGLVVFERSTDGSIGIRSGSGGEPIKLDNFGQLERAARKLRPKISARKR